MTELEKAIMGEEITDDSQLAEAEDNETDILSDSDAEIEEIPADFPEDEITENTEISYAHIEIQSEDEEDETVKELKKSTVEIERMKAEIKQENEQLDIKFAQVRSNRSPRPAAKRKYFYIGTFSAAASLIFMGIAMTVSLFSPVGVVGAFKLAPVMLVFLGIEILLAVIANRSARLKYNVKSLILTILLIGVTCIMSVISVTNSATGGERYYAAQRIENMLSREISENIPSDIIRDVAIELQLHGSDPYAYENISDLESGDVINLEITYINAQVSMYEFASNCRRVMDGISAMPYNFGTIDFIADDEINSYRMEINWLYQSNFTAAELMPLVNYFGNDIVIDIPDLSDDE